MDNMLICTKKTCFANGQPQSIDNFYKDKQKINGYSCWCKTCKKQNREENKDIINKKLKKSREENKDIIREYSKIWRDNNPEKIKEYSKKWRDNNPEKIRNNNINNKKRSKEKYILNKDQILKTSKEYKKSISKFDTFFIKLEKYEPIRRDPNNNILLQVQCTQCKKWINPTNMQVQARITAINGKGSSNGVENRFYCSDDCKKICPVYHKQTRSNIEKWKNKSRPLQKQLRNIVLHRDNHTCQLCGEKENLICHHFTGVEQNPIESADIDNCITVCKECNKKIHLKSGCKHTDMSCDQGR